jgi:hypothetical protein
MPTPDNPESATDTTTDTTTDTRTDTSGSDAVLLTWWRTQTYDHEVPLAELAEATGYTSEEIAASPGMLVGVAGERLAELLTSIATPDEAAGVIEVEIARVGYDASPTLAELAATARAAVDVEADTGQHTPAGLALAALLAGLRREGITGT